MKSNAFRLRVALAAIAIGLAACSASDPTGQTLGWPPDRLYAEAKDEIAAANYERAVQLLQKLESDYPFGRWAQQAQIEIAWAHYKDGERELALAAIDRFIRLHPEHEALDYALYLKGLINFNDQQGMLSWIGQQDLAERDPQGAREAFDAFKQLVTRFPASKYAPDAEARMKYLVNAIARGEMIVARYYLQRGAYIAAANRAQNVIRDYQQAPAVEDALAILVQAYDRLGLDELRDDAKRVLERNFPDSQAMERVSAIDDRRWWQVWR